MDEPSTFVGLDAHKDTIVVAMLVPGAVQPVEWRMVNQPETVRRLARKLHRPGLAPREPSSGDRRRQGGITGAGNRHVRRLLVEAAWHY